MPNLIESLRVKGFRSFADVEIDNMPRVAVLIGANGSGKSNFFRFFEMMRWMIDDHRLNEFVQFHGGADDQLFGGNKISPRMEAELVMRNESERNDYRFGLAYVHPGRFMFTEEAFRHTRGGWDTKATWQQFGSGHTEAKIVEAVRQSAPHIVNQRSASVLSQLVRRCVVYQFHDTSYYSPLKTECDPTENNYLRSNGRNLAAILLRLEREYSRRFKSICDCIRLEFLGRI